MCGRSLKHCDVNVFFFLNLKKKMVHVHSTKRSLTLCSCLETRNSQMHWTWKLFLKRLELSRVLYAIDYYVRHSLLCKYSFYFLGTFLLGGAWIFAFVYIEYLMNEQRREKHLSIYMVWYFVAFQPSGYIICFFF